MGPQNPILIIQAPILPLKEWWHNAQAARKSEDHVFGNVDFRKTELLVKL